MGLFDKLFGTKLDYPPLDAANPAAPKLEEHRETLEALARQVSDPLEVVPAQDSVYVFIGKPPKKFGIAWIEDGKIMSLKDVIQKKKLKPSAVQPVIDKLQAGYENSQGDPRFTADLANRQIVVTPSSTLARTVDQIIREVA